VDGVILETPRLSFREMTLDDLGFVAEMMSDPEVSRYYERQFSRAESEKWIHAGLTRYRTDGHGLWLATLRETGEPVGQAGILMQDVDGARHAELGWLLHRRFWGYGYATEAGAACRDAAFGRWGYDHVISLIRPVNEPSVRVARRLGMIESRRVEFHGFEHAMFYLAAESGEGRYR